MKALPMLNPLESLKSVLCTNYCNFNGRARRSEFFWFIILHYIILFSLSLPITDLKKSNSDIPKIEIKNTRDLIIGIIFCTYVIYSFIPYISVKIRRLHDIGRSGWWFLLTLFGVTNIIYFIMSLYDSKKEENEYGPSPKYIIGLNIEKEMENV